MITELRSASPGETTAIGESIGRELSGIEAIFLKGDLGTGKTLLTKGLATALGIDPEDVVSPGFTLINEFRGKNGTRLVHADLYRLGPAMEELNQLPEIDDYLGEAVVVIEWAQFLPGSYFKVSPSITISLEETGEDERLIRVEKK